MNDLQTLYQDVIIDHSRHPCCYGKLDKPTHEHEGFNPICGDRVLIQLRVSDDTIDAIQFEGKSCAICMASSSLMCETLGKKTLAELNQHWQAFHDLMHEKKDASSLNLGKLSVLKGVRAYPMRIKCATLPWHTLQAALNETKQPASTESSAEEGHAT